MLARGWVGGVGQGERGIEEEMEEVQEENLKSSVLGSAGCYGNSSEARRAADRQTHSRSL